MARRSRAENVRLFELTQHPPRAAEYIRMSTEHQRYSIDNQRAAIANFAERRGIEITETYIDAGRSGLKIEGRTGLRTLLNDVESGIANFSLILVYDISRWGRFQNTDESAYYEHICTRSGIRVEYCAEQFSNDGSVGSTIIKSIKRAMAAEFSRELSVKVSAGKRRLAQMGFHQGGSAGFGFRRQLINHQGQVKGLLEYGERKSIETDRVILVPGPATEQKIVRWIFNAFSKERWDGAQIARELNRRGVLNDRGRPWKTTTIYEVLTSEKYIGNNVINRTSSKLKSERIYNDRGDWIRAERCYKPIVTRKVFKSVQDLIEERERRIPDDELLTRLTALYAARGHLSAFIIDATKGMPSSHTYSSRFGGLVNVYRLIGFKPKNDYQYLEFQNSPIAKKNDVAERLLILLTQHGHVCTYNQRSGILTIDDEISLCVLVSRCLDFTTDRRWYANLAAAPITDLALVVRMAPANSSILDFFLLPRIEGFAKKLLLRETNRFPLSAYRLASLEGLAAVSERRQLTQEIRP